MAGLLNPRLLAFALLPALGCAGDGPLFVDSESDTTGTDAQENESSGTEDTSAATEGGSTTSYETTGVGSTTSTGTATGTGPGSCVEAPDAPDECCVTPSQGFSPVAPPIEVAVTLMVNGQPMAVSDSDDGDIFLVAKGGDRVHVGRTSFGELKSRVFPGTYDLVYESDSRGPLLPWNARVTLKQGIDVTETMVIDHDVEVVRAQGVVTINDTAPPTSPLDDADLFLADPSGSRTLIARTSLLGAGGTYEANLVPAAYEVHYASHVRKDVMPYNGDSVVGLLTVKDVAAEDGVPPPSQVLPIALKTVTVGGEILFDGVKPPTSPNDHGRLYLRDHETGAVTLIADTTQGAIINVPVLDAVTARYDVVYAAVAHQGLAPINEWAVVLSDRDAAELKADLASLALDTVDVSGTFSIDQAPPVNDPANSGEVILGKGGGDRAFVGGALGALSGVLLAGDYDAFFRHVASDGGLPVNTRGRVQAAQIPLGDDMPPLQLAVKTALVSGSFTLGGATPPASAYDAGRVFLRSADGDVVHLGFTSDLVFERRVITGTYDVYYAAQATSGLAPANHERRLGELVIDGDLVGHTVDVPRMEIEVVNPITTVGEGAGRLYLRDLSNDDEIFVGTTEMVTLSATVIPGVYRLVYRVDVVGGGVAANEGAVFECLAVDPRMP